MEETALDAALDALTSSGWQDVDAADATRMGNAGNMGDVGELVRIAADLRRAIAATPSQQARLRHQAIISRAAWGLRGRRAPIVRVP